MSLNDHQFLRKFNEKIGYIFNKYPFFKPRWDSLYKTGGDCLSGNFCELLKVPKSLFVSVDQIRFQLQVITSQLVRTTLNNDKNMLVISLFMLSPRIMRDRPQSIIHLNRKQRLPTAVPHKNVRGAPLPCKGVLFFPRFSYVLHTINFLA